MDSTGNLYGTSVCTGLGFGEVFKLTPVSGGFTITSLHIFTGGNDGGNPYGGVTLDSNGNLYGTASTGGTGSGCTGGCGVVWEITP